MPRRLGQHFLADSSYRRRIVEAIAPQPNDAILEIGAGEGALTGSLAERAGLVFAVELDHALVEGLRRAFAARPAVRVVEADILELSLDSLDIPSGYRLRAAGNLPYYITSPILLRLFGWANRLTDVTVMVQLEVAHRIVAQPGTRDYGLLSVTTQYYSRPKLLFRLPPGAFRPPPRVDSAVVGMQLAPRREELGIDDARAFLRFAASCFRQKRKTLANNLRGLYPAARVAQALSAAGARPAARAEALSVDQLAALYRALRTRPEDQVR